MQARAQRLDLQSPSSVSYLRELTARQNAVARRIERAISSAKVRWRYQVVLDGLAVVLPTSQIPTLSRIGGVRAVYPDTKYHLALDKSPELIGADQLWGLPNFSTAGNGIKIGIVDEGIDQVHPFFNPAGYVYPPGFPKGNTAYTTPKVIVARAFPPPGETWQYADTPFDPLLLRPRDPRGRDRGRRLHRRRRGPTRAALGRGTARVSRQLQGATPSPPTSSGWTATRPRSPRPIEAAVTDGMDVINLSLGEPEIEPARDIVVAAINGAAKAGVVPTIAAGNEFEDFGDGSVSSPGSASGAITAAAVTKGDEIAPFSSGGPTPIRSAMKPDVSAPGVSILSSVPPREGTWASFSGTSMAAPARRRRRRAAPRAPSGLERRSDQVRARADRPSPCSTRSKGRSRRRARAAG